jgi:uncharacterized protein (TIGR02646 family)
VRRVSFDPKALTGKLKKRWTTWVKDASNARVLLESAFDSEGKITTFKDNIWKRLVTNFLLTEVFHNKCAYCEVNINVSGDAHAEHYRPKGAVTQTNGEGKEVSVEIAGVPHSGYYWLAYEWTNLMPACQRCNTHGKRNFFPVAGVRVADRATVANLDALDEIEKPTLLNPYRDEPSEHLIFGRWGTIASRDNSRRGDDSIQIYMLDRPDMSGDRWIYQQRAMDDWLKIMGDHDSPIEDIHRRLREKLAGLKTGRAPYSAACLDFIRSRDRQVDEILSAP